MSLSNTEDFTLFYFPTSFSSQKVLFALYEKDVVFKPILVNLFSGQHNESWYVKLNPEGCHTPVLKHGKKVIVEPAEIVDYISKVTAGAGGHPLVPDLSSELGQNVDKLRKKLDAVPVNILTYGIIYYPHLSGSVPCQIPGAVQRSMKENFNQRLSLLTDLATKHPDLRDSYLAKSQMSAHTFDIISDESRVKSHLDDIHELFISVEEQLKYIKKVGSDLSDELWLFGPMFTAADISLAILLNRLALLGFDEQFFPEKQFPCTHQYHKQVKNRPAFRKIDEEVANLKYTLLWENLKSASPYIFGTVGVGVLVGAGYYAYKKVLDT